MQFSDYRFQTESEWKCSSILTLTNGDHRKEGRTLAETRVFDRICVFPQPLLPELRDSTQDVQVDCFRLSKRRQKLYTFYGQ